MITEPAPAKINLALHIRRKRADGYHDLETLFAFARDGDVVTVAPAHEDSFAMTGPFASGLGHADNLVTRARDAFRRTFGALPVAITLTKNLPVASGIGGGSADAAATLRALARLHGLRPDASSLMRLASKLGADVPACLLCRTAVGTGRGDKLILVEPLGCWSMLLVNPGVAVSTSSVFAGWDGVDRGPLLKGDAIESARAGRNDLQAAAMEVAPVIGRVLEGLEMMRGAAFVRMSGSGATCFALFNTDADCVFAAAEITDKKPHWWVMKTMFA